MQAPRSKMISYSRVTHTGKRLASFMCCLFISKWLHGLLFIQSSAAPQHPPVPGTVCRGHPHPAGLWVLWNGECPATNICTEPRRRFRICSALVLPLSRSFIRTRMKLCLRVVWTLLWNVPLWRNVGRLMDNLFTVSASPSLSSIH